MRELENPEVACAVDALQDFMECFPETWGKKAKGSIVPLPKRHYDSVWLSEYLSSFLSVPFFIEAPELRAWLLKAGILQAGKGSSGNAASFSADALISYDDSNLRADLQSLRQVTQDEVIQRVKEQRPDVVDKIVELMQREESQFMKNMYVLLASPLLSSLTTDMYHCLSELRDLVYRRALQWMKRNKTWIERADRPLSELPEILSVISTCYIELDPAQLLEELKMRQYVEIAPLEPEETDEAHDDEVVWHMDHLDLKSRRYHSSSNFSCGRLIVLIVVLAIVASSFIQIMEFVGLIKDPKQPPTY